MTTQQPICPACFGSTTNISNHTTDEPCPYCCGAGYVSLKMAQDYALVRHMIVYAPTSPLPSELKSYAAYIDQERKARLGASITLYAQFHEPRKVALMDAHLIILSWWRNVAHDQETLQNIASDEYPSVPADAWLVRWVASKSAYKISWEAQEHAHA